MSTQRTSQHDSHADVDVMDIKIPMFNVILYNDDYTTFEFVINVLVHIFHKPEDEARQITLNVHRRGRGVAGHYPREVAEMKVAEVHRAAENAGFPLRAGIESA